MASFAEQIEGYTEEYEQRLETAVRKIAIDVFTRVILRSPVLSGRFRGNWQCSVGNVPEGTLELDDKTGTATIAKAQAEALQLKAGETIYLVNNLPYGNKLENGWSQQAPGGMVGITEEEYRPIVDSVARELNK